MILCCVVVGEVPEGRGVLLGRRWALIQEVWSKELLRDRWGDQVSSWLIGQWPGAGGEKEACSKR